MTALTRSAALLAAAMVLASAPAAHAAVTPPKSPTVSVNVWNSFLVGPGGVVSGAGWTNYQALGSPADGIPARTLRRLSPLPGGAVPVAVDNGGAQVVIVADNGKAYGAGANFGGQLGALPTQVMPWSEIPGLPAGTSAIDVSASQNCTAILLADGQILRTGSNGFGQCPLTPGSEPNALTELPGIPVGRTAVDVAVGGNGSNEFLLVLLDNGQIYGTGDDGDGELVGQTGNQSALVPLSALPDDDEGHPVEALAVAAGTSNAYVISSDGHVYGAGSNTAHQLTGASDADVTTWQQLSGLPVGVHPVQTSGIGLTTAVLGDDGEIYAAGNILHFLPEGSLEPDNVTVLTPLPRPAGMGLVQQIDGANDDLVARAAGGLVWGAGQNNSYGQLGGMSPSVYGFKLIDGQAFVNLAPPAVAGTARYGRKLIGAAGSWLPAATSHAYQWRRGGVAIAGATAPTYTIRRIDVGRTISLSVTASGPGLVSTGRTSAGKIVAKQIFSSRRPTIKGSAKVGKKLSIRSRGTWTGRPSSYSYRWLRNGKAIGGATGRTYRLKKKDRRKKLTIRITARRSGSYSAVAISRNYRRP